MRTELRSEAGLTLIEVIMAALVTAVAVGVFSGVLVSVQSAVNRHEERSRDNDQARLAIEQLDREIRSGDLVYNPASESPPNRTLRVLSQSNGTSRCIQWTISDGRLMRRSWTPSYGAVPPPASVGGWRVVAEGIANADVTPTVPAFRLASPTAAVGRTLEITILADVGRSSAPARIETSITGRNTTRGARQDACTPLPAGTP